ncbi:lipoyl(octanoyl) transferase LipB [Chitinophaga costaii]|uniref:lipoyl(octanoyl) transferase LipB n=1 Tax=Chitinophaga costaii TaxID=1335309 RepID=UPI000B7D762B|nr:lipoyl(octanoyl) transferase LipB [Chitinophaga costaii]PUZ30608.1 lipoyl(octanoyl) transferase LipB [Chitinophaga costaii]
MNKITVTNLGSIDYQAAWDLQEQLLQQAVTAKRQRMAEDEGVQAPAHHLLFCEHPLVYTLGKSGQESNLLISDTQLAEGHIQYVKTNRGGDITFHGPGQLVGYPILDLEQFFTDIGKYLRFLEEITIRTLADYGITGLRSPGETGVWLDPGTPQARKICAMGVRCSRWVTMHGFALNVNTEMRYFDNIIPCGITDKKVTSLEQELGRKVPMDEVRGRMIKYFGEVFDAVIVESAPNSVITTFA